jgi:hypothetical protein
VKAVRTLAGAYPTENSETAHFGFGLRKVLGPQQASQPDLPGLIRGFRSSSHGVCTSASEGIRGGRPSGPGKTFGPLAHDGRAYI